MLDLLLMTRVPYPRHVVLSSDDVTLIVGLGPAVHLTDHAVKLGRATRWCLLYLEGDFAVGTSFHTGEKFCRYPRIIM